MGADEGEKGGLVSFVLCAFAAFRLACRASSFAGDFRQCAEARSPPLRARRLDRASLVALRDAGRTVSPRPYMQAADADAAESRLAPRAEIDPLGRVPPVHLVALYLGPRQSVTKDQFRFRLAEKQPCRLLAWMFQPSFALIIAPSPAAGKSKPRNNGRRLNAKRPAFGDGVMTTLE